MFNDIFNSKKTQLKPDVKQSSPIITINTLMENQPELLVKPESVDVLNKRRLAMQKLLTKPPRTQDEKLIQSNIEFNNKMGQYLYHLQHNDITKFNILLEIMRQCKDQCIQYKLENNTEFIIHTNYYNESYLEENYWKQFEKEVDENIRASKKS